MALEEWEDESGIHSFESETGIETIRDPNTGAILSEIDHFGMDDFMDDEEDEEEEEEQEEERREEKEERTEEETKESEQEPKEKEAEGEGPEGEAGEAGAEGGEAAGEAAEAAEAAEGAEAAAAGAEAAEAGAMAAEAGAAAAEGAAVAAEGAGTVAFLPEIAIGCLIVLGIIIVIVVIAFVINAVNPDGAYGDTISSAPTKICLDAGHGGADSGATNGSFKESDMALKMAKELEPKLKGAGYEVVMTRTEDKHTTTTDTKAESVARSEFCKSQGAHLMYRIHLDARTEPQRTFHIIPGPKYDKIHDNSLAYGEKIHETMIKELAGAVLTNGKPIKDGGTVQEGTSSYTRVLEGTKKANELGLPLLWLEALAINNDGVKWIENDGNREKLLDSILKGFQAGVPTTQGGSNAKIVEIALREYNLKPRPAESGGKNCGVDKYTMGTCEAWCADFASYVLKEAGKPFTGGLNGGYRIPGVSEVWNWFEKEGLFIEKSGPPMPGDIAIFKSSRRSHVNIVIEVKGSEIITIGGNEGNTIGKDSTNWKTNSDLVGFGRMR